MPVASRPAASSVGRLLVPVALIAGLIALSMAVGIPWTGSDDDGGGVTLQAAAGQGAKLTITELEPGESVSRSVTIRNSGAAESRLTFEESAEPAGFAGGLLHLLIEQDGRVVYDGQFGAMNDVVQDVGSLPPSGASEFTFTVSLPEDAPFANQGEPAVATYTWVNSDGGV